jgi:hypothetical protein
MARHFVLIDACVASAYFAPQTTKNQKIVRRAHALFTGISPRFSVRFLMPNFGIAEVFSVFEKYRWGATWNPQLRNQSRALTHRQFLNVRQKFRDAIHKWGTNSSGRAEPVSHLVCGSHFAGEPRI